MRSASSRAFLKTTGRVFLSLLLLCAAQKSFAQHLYIAHDFENCGVGLKDSTTGQWVVQPTYVNIYPLGKFFKSFDGNKVGLISPSGKQIVIPKYDNIFPKRDSATPYFTFYDHRREGLIDDSGRVVLPARYSITVTYRDSAFAFRRHGRTRLYMPGKTPIKIHSHGVPEYIGNGLFIVNKSYRKYGLIDSTGKTI
ncbi:MAG TPA: hypothetical protein VFU15_10905, partial [Bacteroidia bacterium]|nr:hypothetical protein [Bacteroidia bacterium]